MIKMKEKITKDMLLGEVVNKYPKSIEVFMKHGLPCAMCGAAFSETVEQGAASHGIDLKSLLKDLNKFTTKK
jgi:hybrid cluster-associated redox disulfide protein